MSWEFHDQRVRNHIKGFGFGLNAKTISAEDTHKFLNSNFDLARLQEILPKEFEKREKFLRFLSHLDKKGVIPRIISIARGPSVTDIKKDYKTLYKSPKTGELKPSLLFLNTTGKKRLAEVERLGRKNSTPEETEISSLEVLAVLRVIKDLFLR